VNRGAKLVAYVLDVPKVEFNNFEWGLLASMAFKPKELPVVRYVMVDIGLKNAKSDDFYPKKLSKYVEFIHSILDVYCCKHVQVVAPDKLCNFKETIKRYEHFSKIAEREFGDAVKLVFVAQGYTLSDVFSHLGPILMEHEIVALPSKLICRTPGEVIQCSKHPHICASYLAMVIDRYNDMVHKIHLLGPPLRVLKVLGVNNVLRFRSLDTMSYRRAPNVAAKKIAFGDGDKRWQVPSDGVARGVAKLWAILWFASAGLITKNEISALGIKYA
jgi:hypothetical protein